MAKKVGPKEQALRAARETKTAIVHIHTGPMTRAEAKDLTRRINETGAALCELLLEAHDRSAWIALGYESWREYATAEFTISQSRAYQLLTQAKVQGALRAASGSPEVRVTEGQAREIAPRIEEVADEVRARVDAGEPPAEAVESVIGAGTETPENSTNVEKRGKAADAPEGEFTAADVQAELERMDAELRRLQELVKSLEASDQARETKKWADRCAGLEGRLRQESATRQEAEKQAQSLTKLLKKIAKAAGVDDFGEIAATITDLRR